MAAHNRNTVLGLREMLREARLQGTQFTEPFQSFLYAYTVSGVQATVIDPAFAEIPACLLKVGIASAFNLGERLDGELAGANDSLHEWLRERCVGSLRNASAWRVKQLYDEFKADVPALVYVGPIDVGYEPEYCRAFGHAFAAAAYLPLLRPEIDRRVVAAAQLPLFDEPALRTHPDSDARFEAALAGANQLRKAMSRVAPEKRAKRVAHVDAIESFLALAGADALAVYDLHAPLIDDFVTGPRSDIDRGRRIAEALHEQLAKLAEPVKQRQQRAATLAARAAAAAFAADPGAEDLSAYTLGASGAVSWKTVLGKRAATNLGPTELVAANPQKIADVRRDGLLALQAPVPEMRPARLLLHCGGQTHDFVPFTE